MFTHAASRLALLGLTASALTITACQGVSETSALKAAAHPIVWGCTSIDPENDGAIQIQNQGSNTLVLAFTSSSIGFWATSVKIDAAGGFTPSDVVTAAANAPAGDMVDMFINYFHPAVTNGEGHAMLKASGETLFEGDVTCGRGKRVIDGAINF